MMMKGRMDIKVVTNIRRQMIKIEDERGFCSIETHLSEDEDGNYLNEEILFL